MMTSTPTPLRVCLHTLGCKTNLLESSALGQAFSALGWQVLSPEAATLAPQGQHPHLHVINTCTVTEKADAEARRLIRKVRRQHPQAKVAVTGCYVQVNPQLFVKQEEGPLPKHSPAPATADFIIGNAYKDQLAALVNTHFELAPPTTESWLWVDDFDKSRERSHSTVAVASSAGLGRSRASLKIQDGCDYKCTYCIIWQGRGPSRSVPAASLLQETQRLLAEGFGDITLTGINIGQYAHEGLDLAGLLQYLLAQLPATGFRFRLTSLDPLEVDEALMQVIATSGGRIAPHIHLSVQSAENGVLKAMARRHKVEDFVHIVHRLHALLPHVAIGGDLIVGFPTEDEAAFAHTLQVIEGLPLAYLHLFRYSPRPGTPAASLHPQVPERVRKERATRMAAVMEAKQRAFQRRFVGTTQLVVVEEADEAGVFYGLTPHYLKVRLQLPANDVTNPPLQPHLQPKQWVWATIEDLDPHASVDAPLLATLSTAP